MLIGQVSDNPRLEIEKIIEDKLRAYRSYVGKVMSVTETGSTKGIITVHCPELDGTSEKDAKFWPAKPASFYNFLMPDIGDSVEVRFPFGGDGSTLEYYAKFYDGSFIHSGTKKKVLFEVDKTNKALIYYDSDKKSLVMSVNETSITISADTIKIKTPLNEFSLDTHTHTTTVPGAETTVPTRSV